MERSTRDSGTATIVDVVGDITLYNSPDMRKMLIDLLKTQRKPRVIVNMLSVKYIDSAGVASLVEGLKIARDLKSTFALFGLSRTAREVLELTRLIKVFEVYNSEQEALQGGGAPAASARQFSVGFGGQFSGMPLPARFHQWHLLNQSAQRQLTAWPTLVAWHASQGVPLRPSSSNPPALESSSVAQSIKRSQSESKTLP